MRKRLIIGLSLLVLGFLPTSIVLARHSTQSDHRGIIQHAYIRPLHSTSVGQPVATVAAPVVANTGAYVALGDSVAAGLGLTPVISMADPACGTTGQAYPALVAQALQKPTYINVACSGATAGDIVTEQHLSGTSRDIEPQLNQAFANGVPSLMTITAGANDTYWTYFLRKCYAATCGTTSDSAISKSLLTVLRLKLNYALDSIERRSHGQTPRVIMTGYYKPIGLACTAQQMQLTKAELRWLNDQTDALNGAILRAARNHASFARYASVSFSGHQLCNKDPWVQGLQDAAPFHPTARGQQAISEAVVSRAK